MKITVNKAKCKLCKDEIESTHRHDFKMCKCGGIGVDGGKDYIRRVGEQNNIEELSIIEDGIIEEFEKEVSSINSNITMFELNEDKITEIRFSDATYDICFDLLGLILMNRIQTANKDEEVAFYEQEEALDELNKMYEKYLTF